MDLIAYKNVQDDKFTKYIEKYYGEIPRCRGYRLMKLEEKCGDEKPNIDVTDLFPLNDDEKNGCDFNEETDLFNKYVGQDVIYIHTRCGDCGFGYDSEDSNYIYCGAKDWEEKYKDLFLEHITDSFDSTYCTHYFKAIINDEYKELLKTLNGDE